MKSLARPARHKGGGRLLVSDRDRGVEDAVGAYGSLGSREGQDSGEWQVVRRAADRDAYLSWLDDLAAGQAGERGAVRVQAERDPAPLAGLQWNPGEASQPAYRADQLGDRIAEVQLDDLGARPRAGVAYRRGDLCHCVGGDLGWRHYEIGVCELGVGQPVAEGEQRRRVDHAAVVPAGQRRAQVRSRLPGLVAWHLDWQLATGHDLTGEHAGDSLPALLTGEERLR